ncbi:hypothetical protein L1987_21234 [Smallanthus sonchifolius]|uniref:Uncharacterized protein n=1 Tax=Smallanthus sonchifolius TaxID=185202 RepID=A0ACB9IVH2_9ASTR|nr:hypothetical protein L1987_21234 [Smallanthus sonchifolius]
MARHAYLVGYKALAKELSVKGQLHNMQMKAAHGKAQESIYRQRLESSEPKYAEQWKRRTRKHVQVYICVGTGHHTRGTRTPARLPVAVQRYLLEEEGLDYSEPQPGLLRVRLY